MGVEWKGKLNYSALFLNYFLFCKWFKLLCIAWSTHSNAVCSPEKMSLAFECDLSLSYLGDAWHLSWVCFGKRGRLITACRAAISAQACWNCSIGTKALYCRGSVGTVFMKAYSLGFKRKPQPPIREQTTKWKQVFLVLWNLMFWVLLREFTTVCVAVV